MDWATGKAYANPLQNTKSSSGDTKQSIEYSYSSLQSDILLISYVYETRDNRILLLFL